MLLISGPVCLDLLFAYVFIKVFVGSQLVNEVLLDIFFAVVVNAHARGCINVACLSRLFVSILFRPPLSFRVSRHTRVQISRFFWQCITLACVPMPSVLVELFVCPARPLQYSTGAHFCNFAIFVCKQLWVVAEYAVRSHSKVFIVCAFKFSGLSFFGNTQPLFGFRCFYASAVFFSAFLVSFNKRRWVFFLSQLFANSVQTVATSIGFLISFVKPWVFFKFVA